MHIHALWCTRTVFFIFIFIVFLFYVVYNRYQDFGTEEWLRQMGGVFCPKVDCGNGMLPDPGQRRIELLRARYVVKD